MATVVAAPAERLEARQQFGEGERLDEVIVAAGAQSAHAIVDLAERADDQGRRDVAGVAQSAHDGDAVDVRQHAVDGDHRIGARRRQASPSLPLAAKIGV